MEVGGPSHLEGSTTPSSLALPPSPTPRPSLSSSNMARMPSNCPTLAWDAGFYKRERKEPQSCQADPRSHRARRSKWLPSAQLHPPAAWR